MTRYFAITPGDAWFFRDARPFNQADPAQMAVPSLFPPMPTTTVGLLRAALARGRDWPGSGEWSVGTKALLGDGHRLGRLRFSGPYLRFGREQLFPTPNLLFGRREQEGRGWVWRDLVRLRPGGQVRCDLSDQPVCLPIFEREADDPKPLFGDYFLTEDGMADVLRGDPPERPERDIVDRKAIAAPEPRVRLRIEPNTGTAEPGLLFTTEFVRPALNTALIVGLDGLDDLSPHNPVAFGGENRWAWIEDCDDIVTPEAPEFARADNGDVLYTAILLTAADLESRPTPGEPIAWRTADGAREKLPGTVVTAALDRALRPGEWRSYGIGRGPQPSPPLLPAGSTWFLRTAADQADAVRARHRSKIGRRTEWGFGEILIGTWREIVPGREAR